MRVLKRFSSRFQLMSLIVYVVVNETSQTIVDANGGAFNISQTTGYLRAFRTM